MLLVEKNSLYMCYETCPMTPTMSESSKIRELKERAIYKLTLRYGRPFVVFLNTPRLAGAIGSRPEDGNKQIPASVQQLTRAIRAEGVTLAAMQKYAKYADGLQGMLMDSDKLKRDLLRDKDGSGSGSGSGFLSSVFTTVTGRSPTDSGNPVETLETVKAQVRKLQNKLSACETSDNRRELQQAMQELERVNVTVQSLSQQIEDLNKKLREEEAEKARLMTQLSTESQAAERTRQAAAAAERKRQADQLAAERLAAGRKRQADQLAAERLAAGRLDTIRLEAGRRSADRRGRSGRTPQGRPQGPRTVDEEQTKKDECVALPTGFVSAPTVEKKVTTKEILEFAQATGFDKNKILVYSNRRNLVGFAFYCPIFGVKIDGRNSTVDIDKRGQKVTLKTGRDANGFVIMSDFYVDKESFAAFLASERGTARAAPAAPATPPEPTRTPVDRFAGIKGTDDLSDSASDSDDEETCSSSVPDGFIEFRDILGDSERKKLVNAADGYTGRITRGGLNKDAMVEKMKALGLDTSGQRPDLNARLTEYFLGQIRAYMGKGGQVRISIGGNILGFTYCPVLSISAENRTAEYESADGKKTSKIGEDQYLHDFYVQDSYTESAPAAPTRAVMPEPVAAPVRQSTRSTPAPAPVRQSSTSGIASGLDYQGWQTATAGTYTARKYGGGKKGKKAASKAKSAAWEKYKKSKGRSLMDRIENFEGVDGVVPALPSIRIPERHEM